MSRRLCDVGNMPLDEMVVVLNALRDLGVSSVQLGPDGVVGLSFFQAQQPAPPAATAAPSPSTPEHSGKSDPSEDEKPKKDIFDVLSEGLIPGAPSRDGLAGTPSPG